MNEARRTTALLVFGLLIAIGCGGGTPQDVFSQPQTSEGSSGSSVQLAQALPESAGTTGSAAIRGTVKFSGSAPAQERIKMDADPQCLLQHKEPVYKQEVVVNPNGTLKHVFVYVKQGLEGHTFPPLAQPVTLDQHGCLYNPHVFGIQVNQSLEIVNSDPTLHNVNCRPAKSQPFNIAQPVKGMKMTKKFTKPEIMVKCACNIHPWMATYIGVVEHSFFNVTDEEGTFTIAGLPPGEYTIEAWHEKLGTQTQELSVGDGEAKQIGFEFKAQ